jgi:hypothetical protein
MPEFLFYRYLQYIASPECQGKTERFSFGEAKDRLRKGKKK